MDCSTTVLGFTAAEVIAIAAAIISAITMAATRSQAEQQRSHDMLSVRPSLDYTLHRLPATGVKLTVTNHGLGPAVVRAFFLRAKGCQVSHEDFWDEIPGKMLAYRLGQSVEVYLIESGSIIGTGASIDLIQWQSLERNTPEWDKAAADLDQVNCEIVYESMYGERFVARCGQDAPKLPPWWLRPW